MYDIFGEAHKNVLKVHADNRVIFETVKFTTLYVPFLQVKDSVMGLCSHL